MNPDRKGPSQGHPAPRECRQKSIGRISPQQSVNPRLPVELGTSLKRRGFLGWGILSLIWLSLLGLSRIVQAFLSVGRDESRPVRFPVGRPEDFTFGDVVKKEGIYLVRDEKGLFALKGDCPHLGCGFRWNAEIRLFECPCHGSRFELNGRFISGPAKKPLQHVSLTMNQNGEIIADVLKPVPEEFRLP